MLPSLVLASFSAPALSRWSTHSKCPLRGACIKAVLPSVVLASFSAPVLSRSQRIEVPVARGKHQGRASIIVFGVLLSPRFEQKVNTPKYPSREAFMKAILPNLSRTSMLARRKGSAMHLCDVCSTRTLLVCVCVCVLCVCRHHLTPQTTSNP